MRSLARVVLCLCVGGASLAQAPPSPAPRPAPRKPAARPANKATPTPKPTPTPVPMGEEFLALVKASGQKDPENEADRKLLLARIARHQGQAEEAQRLLDESEQGILALPKNSGYDQKSINFGRMYSWWSWISFAMKVAPERGLKSVKPFTEDANPNYSGPLLESVAREVDCAQPAQKAALDAAVAEAFDSGKTMLSLDRESWALNAWKAAVRSDLRCGSYARASQVQPLIESAIKKKGKGRLECDHLSLRAWTRLPQLERALASFSENVATDYNERIDTCEDARVQFAAQILKWSPPSDAQKPALVAFVGAAVADLKPLQPEPEPAKGKKAKGPLPSLGSDLYDVSTATAYLADLVALAPDAAAAGADRSLELWRAQWGSPKARGGDRVLGNIASLGAKLAQAGRKPDWLCGLTAVQPTGELKPEAQASLRVEHQWAALELRQACPAEAEAVLGALSPAGDTWLVAALVSRTAADDRARADAMARAAWPQVPEDKRYGFAARTVVKLLGVPDL